VAIGAARTAITANGCLGQLAEQRKQLLWEDAWTAYRERGCSRSTMTTRQSRGRNASGDKEQDRQKRCQKSK